jgi:hypothetical protein
MPHVFYVELVLAVYHILLICATTQLLDMRSFLLREYFHLKGKTSLCLLVSSFSLTRVVEIPAYSSIQ